MFERRDKRWCTIKGPNGCKCRRYSRFDALKKTIETVVKSMDCQSKAEFLQKWKLYHQDHGCTAEMFKQVDASLRKQEEEEEEYKKILKLQEEESYRGTAISSEYNAIPGFGISNELSAFSSTENEHSTKHKKKSKAPRIIKGVIAGPTENTQSVSVRSSTRPPIILRVDLRSKNGGPPSAVITSVAKPRKRCIKKESLKDGGTQTKKKRPKITDPSYWASPEVKLKPHLTEIYETGAPEEKDRRSRLREEDAREREMRKLNRENKQNQKSIILTKETSRKSINLKKETSASGTELALDLAIMNPQNISLFDDAEVLKIETKEKRAWKRKNNAKIRKAALQKEDQEDLAPSSRTQSMSSSTDNDTNDNQMNSTNGNMCDYDYEIEKCEDIVLNDGFGLQQFFVCSKEGSLDILSDVSLMNSFDAGFLSEMSTNEVVGNEEISLNVQIDHEDWMNMNLADQSDDEIQIICTMPLGTTRFAPYKFEPEDEKPPAFLHTTDVNNMTDINNNEVYHPNMENNQYLEIMDNGIPYQADYFYDQPMNDTTESNTTTLPNHNMSEFSYLNLDERNQATLPDDVMSDGENAEYKHVRTKAGGVDEFGMEDDEVFYTPPSTPYDLSKPTNQHNQTLIELKQIPGSPDRYDILEEFLGPLAIDLPLMDLGFEVLQGIGVPDPLEGLDNSELQMDL